jgi:hypothetical protein
MRWSARSLPCLLLAACGGNVVVDGAPSSTGTKGTGGSTTGTSTGTGTGTGTGPQVPDGGSPQCQQEYVTVLGELENALGCTPTASETQCSGMVLLHDPCGCLLVANEAHPNNINMANDAYDGCLTDGCCGPQAAVGCSPCPPPPTVGHCDTFTSRCVAGP